MTGIDWQVRPPAAAERSRSLVGSGFNTSLANLLVLRGKDVFSADTGQEAAAAAAAAHIVVLDQCFSKLVILLERCHGA